MKNLLIIFLCFFICTIINPSSAQTTSPGNQFVQASVTFDGERYNLAFSEIGTDSQGYINEYLRPGETLDNWEKIIALHHFPNINNPNKYAQNLSQQIAAEYPKSPREIIKQKNEVAVCFLIWTDEEPRIAELNVFRMQKAPKDKGIIAYQYAVRCYGDLTEEFQQLVENRKTLVDKVFLARFPKLFKQKLSKTADY